jgi:membrane protein
MLATNGKTVVQKLSGSLRRVFPACQMPAQAVAFNMFLAFFPMLLFALGVLNVSEWVKGADSELPDAVRLVLPTDSARLVLDYLVRRGVHPWNWMFLGLGGMLLAGTQVMIGLMEGFRLIVGDADIAGFWQRQRRAGLLLCLSIAPFLAASVLSVFGRQFRNWLILELGAPNLLRSIGVLIYAGSVLALCYCVMLIIYRLGKPPRCAWTSIAPGAFLATVLWWVVDVSLGFYFQQVPYGVIYGGLAAAIGLLIWMYLSAVVIFVGAAYNVECSSVSSALQCPRPSEVP